MTKRIMRATSSIVTSTRSSTVSLRACEIGRIPHFIETFAQEYSRLIGRVTVKQAVISASESDRSWSGGLRFANPPYGKTLMILELVFLVYLAAAAEPARYGLSAGRSCGIRIA